MNTVQAKGYYVVLYASKSWLTTKLDMGQLKDFDVWVAQYYSSCTYTGEHGMWQYTSSGKVNGISGNVDMNEAYKDYASIITKNGLNGFTKSVTTPASKTPAKTAPKVISNPYTTGKAIFLNKTPLYASATAKKASGYKTGTFYIYDEKKTNGRYRITNAAKNCGRTPTGIYTTGWING